jgi:hypothetical protein
MENSKQWDLVIASHILPVTCPVTATVPVQLGFNLDAKTKLEWNLGCDIELIWNRQARVR